MTRLRNGKFCPDGGVDGAPMGDRIDAARESRNYGDSAPCEVGRDPFCDVAAVGRRPTRADNRNNWRVDERIAPLPAPEDHDRRVVGLCEHRRVYIRSERHHFGAGRACGPEFPPGPIRQCRIAKRLDLFARQSDVQQVVSRGCECSGCGSKLLDEQFPGSRSHPGGEQERDGVDEFTFVHAQESSMSGMRLRLATKLAEACGNRTHPDRLSATRNGFEAREDHQAPFASRCLKERSRQAGREEARHYSGARKSVKQAILGAVLTLWKSACYPSGAFAGP